MPPEPRLLLLVPSETYRATDFAAAARRVGASVIVASDHRQAWEGPSVVVDFADPEAAAGALVEAARAHDGVDAVIAVDDAGVVPAALAAQALGLRANPVDAAQAARNKVQMRAAFAAAGVPQPRYEVALSGEDVRARARAVGLPVVLKPASLAASKGVIRVDRAEEVEATAARVRAIAGSHSAPLLVEAFVSGAEVAVEAIVRDGDTEVLAVFDKPDPLDGPFFAETIYVTPSRHRVPALDALSATVRDAVAALGLREGPVHAEARLTPDGPVMLEVAARTIGGLCSRTLQFGLGVSLEDLVIRHALGRPLGNLEPVAAAAGVVMLPVPVAGTVRRIAGVDDARAVAGVAGVEITVVVGSKVAPLPDGDRYLGFIFARGPDPGSVEATLRDAWSRVRVDIDPAERVEG